MSATVAAASISNNDFVITQGDDHHGIPETVFFVR